MVLSEIEEVIFGNDATSTQAKVIGIHSGAPLIRREQARLYKELRERDHNPDSDQVVYATVLEETYGPVDVFRAVYPHVFKRI